MAPSFVPGFFAIRVPTRVPRPPVPMMPNETAELAWYPNAVWELTMSRLAAVPAVAARLVMSDMMPECVSQICRDARLGTMWQARSMRSGVGVMLAIVVLLVGGIA